MTETGGTTTTSPRSSRLVVVVGGGVPDTPPSAGPVALRGDGLQARIAELRATAAHEAERRRSSIESRRDRAATELAAARAELHERTARHEARCAEVAVHVTDIDTTTQRRLANLDALRGAVAGLDDAVKQWSKVLDQQRDADRALDAICDRLGSDDAPSSPERIAEEMAEGEGVLGRTETARREGVAVAIERLLAVRSVLDGDTDALRLAGLVRLRDAIEHGTVATADLDERIATLEAEVVAADAELEAEEPQVVDDVDVALDLVASAGGSESPLVVDDLLVHLGDEACQRVLDALPERLAARQLVYLTGDVRVLSWAIGLPPDVGGVAGAADHPATEE